RPRRAARGVGPDRGAVARPHRRRGEARSRRGRGGRPPDDRRRVTRSRRRMNAIPARETMPMVDEPLRPARHRTVSRMLDLLVRSLVPVILALIAGGILLVILGRDPIQFYQDIWHGGVQQGS